MNKTELAEFNKILQEITDTLNNLDCDYQLYINTESVQDPIIKIWIYPLNRHEIDQETGVKYQGS
jgi:hypothetical protein